ncbi:hypothetical protein Y900_013030 [Mycolicibacterium aromaticivorans JS19b1 = JCM 16368]|uniref:DUF4174 domain-containing protein n=1 Tax=Mycolicibacterium aromaticivorans JS19b1 = JCM 16368 TaxID=1440774 RepID=A0A064CMB2_9MYCO|nr:DUF4174 domain-containing protein [Mycolicibacterium aromaticivorans]KDE99833.1 hypothetical protein Y900_013030 [Mycolicibacterium aromaticivorans JS19b1 = JCM 16368]
MIVAAGLRSLRDRCGDDELGDYRWERRPLLVFAPTLSDPRLAETLSRTEASRCDFASRDVMLGQVLATGSSALDGQPVDAEQSKRLRTQFEVDAAAFTVVLIGKDGGEKLRVTGVPDLQHIYAVIDGIPLRGNESRANPRRC